MRGIRHKANKRQPFASELSLLGDACQHYLSFDTALLEWEADSEALNQITIRHESEETAFELPDLWAGHNIIKEVSPNNIIRRNFRVLLSGGAVMDYCS